MHRLFRSGLLLLLSVSLLAACAPPAAPPAPTSEPVVEATEAPAEPTEAGQAAPFPVTINHKYGSTTITELPERIVLVGLIEQDALLALGVVPVATREWYGERPGAIFAWAEDKLGDAPLPEVLSSSELSFERIAALQPDVIVGLYSGITQEEYDTLSQIAPTVAQPAEYVDWGIPWQELTRTIGLIVGQGPRAEEMVAEVEAQFAAAREQYPQFAGATGVIASTWGYPESYYIYNSQDVRGRFLTSLGFVVPAEVDELAGSEYGATISLERMDLADQDVLIWMADLVDEEEGLKANPIYNQLAAPKEGRDLFVGPSDLLYDALNFSTVLSLPFAIEGMLPKLAAAVDGDPTTLASGQPAPVAAFPVTIEHKFGSITLEAAPERVVSLGYSEQDPLLALGVVPVAVRDWFGDQPYGVWPWGQEALGDAQPELLQMPFGELNFEQIVALEPDLIVATHSGITAEEYETLSQIAPTLAQPDEYVDFGVPWQEQTRLIGQAVGRAAQAEAVVADVEAQIAAAAAEHPEFEGKNLVFASPTGTGSYWVFSPNTPPLRFLAGLGFSFPEELATLVGDQDALDLSAEQMDLLDVDVLIWQVGSEEEKAALESDPIYQQLAVATEGRAVYFVGLEDTLYGSLSFSTALSLPYAVEGLVPHLAAAVDGDPATVATP